MAIEHYENFPVASFLLPKRLRPAVEAIYAFARSADDLADEGDATADARIHALHAYDAALDEIVGGHIPHAPLFHRLEQTIRVHHLPIEPFRHLLSAFRQDVVTTRYATFDELLDYCRRSANPVGRLMLSLYKVSDPRCLEQSDAICSALQLINFWQDVAIDWQKGRIYLPLDDLARCGVTEAHLIEQRIDSSWRTLMAFQIVRARGLLIQGAPLALHLRGRIGWELRLVVHGGLRILERIEAADFDIFRQRPQLGVRDWLCMGWRALTMPYAFSQPNTN